MAGLVELSEAWEGVQVTRIMLAWRDNGDNMEMENHEKDRTRGTCTVTLQRQGHVMMATSLHAQFQLAAPRKHSSYRSMS